MDLARWEREGWLHLPGVLGTDEVEELRRATASLDRPTRGILEQVPLAREVATSPGVRAPVERVLGGTAHLARALWFDKTPARNWPVVWHQDKTIPVDARHDLPGYGPWSTKGGVLHVEPPLEVLRTRATLRLHLDDCGPGDGALRIVPGTQREKLTDVRIRAAVANAIEPTLRAGDGLLMHPLLLHSSRRAEYPGSRRVLHLEFAR